ncbi:MAG: isoleucine--tRNA ligase [candidate division KSB1 bacterium]|nr:isoleucine--tRNA ligase [candidate division KSB1 bacterium]MDZ7333821.1 isoleucine--tRNA ligase [candidate division KSB1 bacterium]MDZ7356064.1 isoleucine--tRNA ligase [candidate division KSB1 bacterium]MDZ7375213.1 isoleucine--tRNA ligase [candidate division KSB1 bacterium]MDZ7400581.1 isoleucine--tRNA ligase [candidate division KSB1 bacterium]
MLKKVDSQADFVAIEHKILDFWRENQSFKKLVEKNKGKPRWSFLDGPITANNPMGVHHAWGRTYKDIFQRFHAMTGHELRYQNGFDCQGLWVEVEVEKELGIKSKTDIEAYGIENFVNKCKERVMKYSRIQTEQSIRLGYWMDWDNSYYTMSDINNFTIWLFLKKCYDRGWIYKGHDVMPWCIDCGAAMSQHEIATEGYREIRHDSIYVVFPLVGRENENLLVWTTTPWTLPANVAAAVHPEFTYVKVKQGDQIYYLVRDRVREVMASKGEIEILAEMPGAAMERWEFRSPFEELPAQKGVKHPVLLWDEVSAEDGTGIVHIAPGCGKEDFALGQKHGLPAIAPLDQFGTFIDGFDWLTGQNVMKVAEPIIQNLKEKHILYKKEQITHRYPVCWRHGSELVFRLVDEWFIKMDELRYQIMAITQKIRWMPEYGMQLELDWLKNMSDWMISKKRYWGLALPIYECDQCGHFEVIGSIDELKQRAVEGWDQFVGHSPHRPWIDYVKIACKHCGAKVSRIKDVGNPWLDAGIVPYSTMRYLEDRSYWEKWFPADFITECFPGQFRNWFYAILAMSTVMENREPFKTVLGHALVRDEKGEEMHKSAGNAIWFDDAAEKMGVDTMRWMFAEHNPFTNINFGYGPAKEIRKHLLTLWNSYAFWTNYAILDDINPATLKINFSDLTEIDRWVLAKLQQLIQNAHDNYSDYNVMAFMKAAEEFIDDLSNWYVRRNRRRFWKSEKDNDKKVAYFTLHHVLVTLIKLLAPVIPFLTEEMYQNLVRSCDPSAPESVHHCDFPQVDHQFVDDQLVKEVDQVISIVKAGRALRNQTNIKVRQPLSDLVVRPNSAMKIETLKKYEQHIKEELNVKKLIVAAEDTELVEYNLKIDFKLLGPKYGRDLPLIQKALAALPAQEVAKKVRSKLGVELSFDDRKVVLNPDEIIVEIKAKQNYAVQEVDGMLLGINTQLTDELLSEGLARDLVRHIQELRKEADFELNDRIHLFYQASGKIEEAIVKHADYIKAETLSLTIQDRLENGVFSKELKLAGEPVKIGVKLASGVDA